MRINIVDALVQIAFVIFIAGWIVLLAKVAHFSFLVSLVGGFILGPSTVALVLFLLPRKRKR